MTASHPTSSYYMYVVHCTGRSTRKSFNFLFRGQKNKSTLRNTKLIWREEHVKVEQAKKCGNGNDCEGKFYNILFFNLPLFGTSLRFIMGKNTFEYRALCGRSKGKYNTYFCRNMNSVLIGHLTNECELLLSSYFIKCSWIYMTHSNFRSTKLIASPFLGLWKDRIRARSAASNASILDCSCLLKAVR